MAADVKGGASLRNGTTIRGREPAVDVPDHQKLNVRPSHSFLLLFHPAVWDVAMVGGTPTIVPRLREFALEPGFSGVTPRKDKFDGDARYALVQQEAKGWLPIDRKGDWTAFGEHRGDYVQVFDGTRGPVHLSIWRQPYIRGGTVVYDFDEEGYLAFLVKLVEDGIVPGPDRVTRKGLELHMRRQMLKATSSAARSAQAGANAEAFERKLEVFAPAKPAKREAAEKPPKPPKTTKSETDEKPPVEPTPPKEG